VKEEGEEHKAQPTAVKEEGEEHKAQPTAVKEEGEEHKAQPTAVKEVVRKLRCDREQDTPPEKPAEQPTSNSDHNGTGKTGTHQPNPLLTAPCPPATNNLMSQQERVATALKGVIEKASSTFPNAQVVIPTLLP
jgi:hypothetical protein